MSDGWYEPRRSNGLSIWRSEWGNMRALQDQIDSQMAEAASTQRRLSSQLSRLQGDLTQRVDRLAKAFDAFVELSQLRDELGLHADARRWRVAARRLVESTIARGPAPAGGGTESLADVPGYWLAPAMRGLPDAIEHGAHAADLDEAARRDPLRTATFVAAVAPLLRAPALASSWFVGAFGDQPAAAITTAQRALWLAATDGLLAPAALDDLRTVVTARLAAMDAEARRALVATLAAEPPASTSTLRPARGSSAAATQVGAVAALGAWCAFVDAGGATSTAAPPLAGAPGSAPGSPLDAAPGGAVAVAPGGPVAATPGGVGAATPGGVGAPPAEAGVPDLLLDVVRSLVEEGSVEERPLLDRAEQLSAIVDPTGAPPPSEWDGAAGDVAALLVADLRDAAHPGRRRFALTMLRDAIAAAADELATRATVAPAATTEVRVGGRSLRVSVEGADPAELAAATAAAPRPRRVGPVQLGVGGAVVALFVVLAIAVAPGWIVLAIIAAGGIGAWWFVEQSRERAAAAEDERMAQQARQQVADKAAELAGAAGQARGAADEAAALRDQLRAKLATVGA